MQIERYYDPERGISALRITLATKARDRTLVQYAPAALGVLTAVSVIGAVAAALLVALLAGLVAFGIGWALMLFGALALESRNGTRNRREIGRYNPGPEHEDHCW